MVARFPERVKEDKGALRNQDINGKAATRCMRLYLA